MHFYVIHNDKIFQIFVSQRFSVIVTPPLKNGGEHYLKEEQRISYDHRKNISEKREWSDIVLRWCIYFVEENLDFETRLLAT